jgi:nucleotide-binding universal stress UspA family protein
MSIKDALVFVSPDAERAAGSSAAYALSLAKAFDAHLTAFSVQIEIAKPLSLYRAISDEDIAARRAAALEAVRATSDWMIARARESGVALHVDTERCTAANVKDLFVADTQLCDVAVVGLHQSRYLDKKQLAQELVFEAGAPVILVPDDHIRPFACDRVAIAWDGSRNAARAVRDALPVLTRSRDVLIFTATDDSEPVGLESCETVATHLRRHGVPVRCEVITMAGRGIGRTLLDHAGAMRADLLVMGAFGHSRWREFVLGGATADILANASLPVLMSH